MWDWACELAWLQIRLEALEDRDGLAGTHLHHGLLPRPGAAGGDAAALGLGGDLGGAHLDDVHIEQRLDGLLDLRLVRLVVHAERVLVGGRQHVALLGDDRADDYLAVIHQALASLRARAVSLSSAGWLSTSVAARTRSATPTSSTCSTCTRVRLRNDLAAVSSSSASTTSTAPPRWACSNSAAWDVLGSLNADASTT